MRQITVDLVFAKEHNTQYSYVAKTNTIINGPIYLRKSLFTGPAPQELQVIIEVEK